jgi:uncharacterized protein with PQ loop repeat
MDLNQALSATGTGTALVLNLYPLPLYLNAYKTGNTNDISKISLILSHISPLLWILYSLKIKQNELLISAVLNGTLSLYFVLSYFYVNSRLVALVGTYVALMPILGYFLIEYTH